MNTIKIIKTLSLLILCLLGGCGEKTQSVEWYLEHKDMLNKEYEKCKGKTPTELIQDKHCQIIQQAKQKEFNEHEDNAPVPQFDLNKFK